MVGKDRSEVAIVESEPNLTFEKGLLERDNDSIPGYVSDLKNCEIKDGAVERRLGSKCLDTPISPRRWMLRFSEKISGAEIFFCVDSNGAIYAFSDRFPERPFVVNKTGFTQFVYKEVGNVNTVPDKSYELRFDRGTAFWYLPRADKFYIVNNYGDYFSISKFGMVQFLYNTNKNHTVNTVYRLRAVRNFSVTDDCGLYVDAKFNRMKYARPFYMCDAPYDEYVPIRGNIKTAPVDDDGRVGELSVSSFLSRYETKFISMVNCYNADNLRLYDCIGKTFRGDNGIFVYKLENEILLGNGYDILESQSEEIKYRQARLLVTGSQRKDPSKLKLYMYFDAEFFKERIANGDIAVPCTDFTVASSDFTTLLDSDKGFMTARNVRITSIVTSSGTDTGITSDSPVLLDEFNFYIDSIIDFPENPFVYEKQTHSIPIAYSQYKKNLYSYLHGATPSIDQTFEGKLYRLNVTNTTRYLLWTALMPNVDNAGFVKNITNQDDVSLINLFSNKDIKKFLTISIPIVCDNTTGIQKRFAQFAYSYKFQDVDKKLGTTDVALLKNRGFDCWDVEFTDLKDVSEGVDISNVDIDTGDINSLSSEYDIICSRSDYIDWILYGNRFAVWNEGVVLGISQKVFFDSEYKPIYSISDLRPAKQYDDTETGIVPFQTTENIGVGYMPVCALDFMSSRRFGYAGDGNTFGLNNPKEIVVNNNIVYSVMGGSIAVGSMNEAFTFFAYYSFAVDIISIKPVKDGVVVFAKGDIFTMGMDGTRGNVSGVDSLKSKTVIKSFEKDKNVFGLTDAGEIVVIGITFSDTGVPYVACTRISDAISSKKWESNFEFAVCNSTLYVCSGNEIYGYSGGAWTKKHVFDDKKIAGISSYRNKLVVSFDDDLLFRGFVSVINVGGFGL